MMHASVVYLPIFSLAGIVLKDVLAKEMEDYVSGYYYDGMSMYTTSDS